jgi:hypothetical protein
MPVDILKSHYTGLQLAAADLGAAATASAINELVNWSATFLAAEATRQPLVSKVPGKEYFMFTGTFEGKQKQSRPINAALFLPVPNGGLNVDVFVNPVLPRPTKEDSQKLAYTMCASYFAASDLLNDSDQKTPGTFFEVYVGHIFARLLGINPSRTTTTQTIDGPLTIPTDYIFEPGHNRPRIHLPIKTSTRERAVQVWAHQRLLDGMHGDSRFRGILVCFGETNKQKNKSVVEVCVPNQWLAYQRFIARLYRIYYFDPPAKYLALRYVHPPLSVHSFADIFDELPNMLTY